MVADRQQTAPGGVNITLTISGPANTAQTEWKLAPGSEGTLDRNTGASVHYLPPPSGTVIVNNIVNVIAINGDATSNIVIVLSANSSADNGTTGAGTITPPPPAGTPSPTPGIFLLAGNDFGAGMANGTGTSARFDTPNGIARDAQGNLYVADRFNNVIRKISPQAQVTTLAGMPGENDQADGSGAAAHFMSPSGIAVDNAGNIYVADSTVVRKVTPAGVVTTLAGHPDLSGHADGSGADALFSQLTGIAVDASGNIYVSDALTVRKITTAGLVSTIAGQSGAVGAQDGPVASAKFTSLQGIAVDSAGNVFVVDGGFVPGPIISGTFFISASVRKISADGVVSTLAGTGGSGSIDAVTGYADGTGAQARFNYPEGLTIDGDGILYVTDRGNHAIRRVTPDGVVSTVAGGPGQEGSADGAIADARFMTPSGIVVDPDGILLVTDSAHHTVRRIVPGESVTTLAGAAPLSGSADGTRSAALLNEPRGITLAPDGNLHVADTGNNTIRRIASDGVVSTLAGTARQTGSNDGTGSAARFNLPTDVASDTSGNIFVSDFSNRLIRRITPAGVVTAYAGIAGAEGFVDGPAATAQFVEPQALAVDRNGVVYVADRGGDAIRKITPQGVVSTFAGQRDSNGSTDGVGTAARFTFPQDIAVDSTGNVYVIDSGSLIRKITPEGVVTTLAGSAFQRGSQDGTGSAARFNSPQSLTVDGDGNIYVADSRAIRKITPLGVVSTVAGAPLAGQDDRLSSIHRPSGLVLTGPKTLAFTAGNGVFELRLP